LVKFFKTQQIYKLVDNNLFVEVKSKLVKFSWDKPTGTFEKDLFWQYLFVEVFLVK